VALSALGAVLVAIPASSLAAPPKCEKGALYHVDAASKEGDGSKKAPFASLEDALDAAARAEACSVAVVMAEGDYWVRAHIDRPTSILGDGDALYVVLTGAFYNYTAFPLHLENVTIIGDSEEDATVLADHPDQATTLIDTYISSPWAYGVFKRGGRLRMERVIVEGTLADPWDPRSGVGIYATDGAQVEILLSSVRRSESQALVVEGAGTRVGAQLFGVEETGTHPRNQPVGVQMLDSQSAVEIRDGGELVARYLTVRESDYGAITAIRGGRASLTQVTVEGVSSVGSNAGYGVGVNAGSSVAGLMISDLASSLTARVGTVHHNTIGAHVADGTQAHAIADNVVYFDNVRNLSVASGGGLPKP
jgi:hypothetical protein